MTREECEQMYPILKGDPQWELKPTVGRDNKPNGAVAIYKAGAREFAIVLPRLAAPREERG